MERFRKTLKQRILLASLYCLAVLTIIAFRVFRPGDLHVSDFIAGMSLGMCVGIAMKGIFYIIQMTLALRNEEKLKSST